MNERQVEVYRYYKNLYPMEMMLYRIGESYVILGEDACKAKTTLKLPGNISCDVFEFHHSNLDAISELSGIFYIKIIEYRNDSGEFDLPDVNRLEEEKHCDY